MPDVAKQLQAARQRLLDLTMRNRLLNFHPSKRKTIQVIEEIPREIFDILVLQERGMEFRARPMRQQDGGNDLSNTPTLFADLHDSLPHAASEDTSRLWQILPQATDVADHHTDRFLQTKLESEELQKCLYYIHQQARSVFEEQGYTVLYLALGFLEWRESLNAVQPRHAPLLLIPIELERRKVGMAFRLRWTGEELLPNLSLQAKLSEQGIALPDLEILEDKASVDSYFQAVIWAVSHMPTWRVVPDIYVDFFSFTKFVMYKDLDPTTWPAERTPADHPLLRAILDPAPDAYWDKGFSEDDVDEKLTTRTIYHVMDADPSQIAVIEDVKQGRNMVVEGPPGTGKSQTITNIIAELLAAGKMSSSSAKKWLPLKWSRIVWIASDWANSAWSYTAGRPINGSY